MEPIRVIILKIGTISLKHKSSITQQISSPNYSRIRHTMRHYNVPTFKRIDNFYFQYVNIKNVNLLFRKIMPVCNKLSACSFNPWVSRTGRLTWFLLHLSFSYKKTRLTCDTSNASSIFHNKIYSTICYCWKETFSVKLVTMMILLFVIVHLICLYFQKLISIKNVGTKPGKYAQI